MHHFGAILGQGEGRQGQSYGIPTIASSGEVLSLAVIKDYIKNFKQYAKNHPDLKFYMTEIGCGFANYNVDQIAPLFKSPPDNVQFPISFIPFLEDLPIFTIEDIELVWRADETHIELPLNYGAIARLKLNQGQHLTLQPNIWEKLSSDQCIQYLKLNEQQFDQLHHAIEKFKQEEASFFKELI